ncbi:hypothetical protein FRB97_007002 [Tulasnella sp. 331]|nr:hypothetical protein FRB97_007002 [Tulasnella sp. 331]
MNGHAPYANGNGDVTSTGLSKGSKTTRRRTGRKHNKRASTSSLASASSSSSSSGGKGDRFMSNGHGVNGNGHANGYANGVDHEKVDGAALHVHMPTRREYEAWKGVMKKIVDEWEIPRKVLHSSIASTFGRLFGRYTPALPRRIPFLNLPLAPKKSLAGSTAATLTGAITAIGFWGYAVPMWQGYSHLAASEWGPVSWKWAGAHGVGIMSGGAMSLGLVGLVVGLISGVTEALDLGGIDDNLSLPIISGTVLWGLSKFAAWVLNFQL